MEFSAFPPLASPVAFRSGLELSHRVALASMTNMQSHADGTIGDDEMHWLLSRADGGFARLAGRLRDRGAAPFVRRPPFTVEELRARALSPPFAEYMRQWKGFVA